MRVRKRLDVEKKTEMLNQILGFRPHSCPWYSGCI